ncbi:MAG: Wzy polymerase domain-containing protein, partial [Rubrivivax sp.]
AAAAVLLLAAAAASARAAAAQARAVPMPSAPLGHPLLVAFFVGWVVAGLLNAWIAAFQVFLPELADGSWIARSSYPGRAVGNLRQPNHLSSLLLWGTIAVIALHELKRLGRRPGWLAGALMALLVFAVVLTASRTGLVSVLLLAGWGLADRGRQLTRTGRRLLLAAPLLYALAWLAMALLWANGGHHVFGGGDRLLPGAGGGGGDISSSRFGIWADTLALIRAQPWAGVGFGDFNLAWTLTAFPGRPTAFFDHTHNLPLQLIVELGLPLGGLVTALLLVALWQAWRAGRGDVGARCAGMFVVMIGLHSLLEYPLWYAYFLLPAAWAWGWALGWRPPPSHAVVRGRSAALLAKARAEAAFVDSTLPGEVAPHPAARAAPRARAAAWPAWAGALLVVGAAWSVWDYWRVARIFDAQAAAVPLAQRVAEGQRSVLFGHHADYAAATSGLAPPADLAVFRRPAHYLLDTRLMTAWAEALARAGRIDEARWVAARLHEFGPARAEAFFAPCATPASAAGRFACEAPQQAHGWREFLQP